MNIIKYFIIYLISISCIILPSTHKAFADDEYKLLVLNFRGKKEVNRWEPLSKHLSAVVGKDIGLYSISLCGMLKRAEKMDFVLANPVLCVKLLDTHPFEAIATQNHKQLGPRFAGVIIVHQDSPIKTLEHLADKKIGVVDLKNAAGGFLFQAYELLQAGLVPERDFKKYINTPNQNAIVKHVLGKKLEAGFIRTGQLENYKKNHGDVSQLRIINKMTHGLQFPRSTAIYPHWSFLANNKLPRHIRQKIKNALLSLDKNSKTCTSANINGFAKAGDYEKLKTVMNKLKVYDFKH